MKVALSSAGDHYTPKGNKAWQRDTRSLTCPHCGNEVEAPDDEDRALPFRKALIAAGVGVTDMDFIVLDGRDGPKLVLEVTRCDHVSNLEQMKSYLAAIDERRARGTRGNNNDRCIYKLAEMLHVPALLVLFDPKVGEPDARIMVRWIQCPNEWYERIASEWFENTRKRAYGLH